MFETESAEKVTIETQKKPLIICSFLGVFWNICSGSSQPVKAPSEEKVPPEAHKETFCDRNTCTTAAAPEAEKKVLLEKFEHLHAQGSIGASRKIHYGTEDHLGSTRMVLKVQNDGSSTVEQALMYQPYGTIAPVAGILGTGSDPLRQKFTTKEFDENGPDFGQIKFDITFNFALTNTDPTKPNRVEVYYADAPSKPEITYVTLDPSDNKYKITATLNNATSRTIASIQFKLNDDAVSCNVQNINEVTNPGSKLTITKTASAITEFQATVQKTFLNYSNASFYMAGIGAYHFGFRVYDPETGVWMSTDPADQFWNTYSYCGGDPVNYTDPDGANVPAIVFALAGAAIGGYAGGVAGNGGELNPFKWDPANDKYWMIGATAGFAIGGGLGYGIESGALALTDVSLLSNANYAGLSGAAAGQIVNFALESGNSNASQLLMGLQGPDAVTGAGLVRNQIIKDRMKNGRSFDEAEQEYKEFIKDNNEFQWDRFWQALGFGGKRSSFGTNAIYKKQVDDVARELKMTPLQRKDFGKYIEKIKGKSGRWGDVNFKYDELMELGREFLGRG